MKKYGRCGLTLVVFGMLCFLTTACAALNPSTVSSSSKWTNDDAKAYVAAIKKDAAKKSSSKKKSQELAGSVIRSQKYVRKTFGDNPVTPSHVKNEWWYQKPSESHYGENALNQVLFVIVPGGMKTYADRLSIVFDEKKRVIDASFEEGVVIETSVSGLPSQ